MDWVEFFTNQYSRGLEMLDERDRTLKKLEVFKGPLHWGLKKRMDDFEKRRVTKIHITKIRDYDSDDNHLVPFLKFLSYILVGCQFTLQSKLLEARECIKCADKILEIIREDEDKEHFSLEVLENISNGTKAYIELLDWNIDEFDQIKKKIKSISFENDWKARRTLNACKSLAWFMYRNYGEGGIEESQNFAQLAIKDSPDASKWYSILSKVSKPLKEDQDFLKNFLYKVGA